MTWSRTLGKKPDGRNKNGGRRIGAGRPITNKEYTTLKQYFNEDIVIHEFRHGQTRRVKKKVYQVVLDSLREQAIKGDIRSAKVYFNLTLGKPYTPKGKKPRRSPATMRKALVLSGVLKNSK